MSFLERLPAVQLNLCFVVVSLVVNGVCGLFSDGGNSKEKYETIPHCTE